VALVLADEAQLGQLLITLSVNARDAMLNGGTLTIETESATLPFDSLDSRATSLPPGDYVRLVVRDTGIGMDATTRARAFEPFFTTKPPGKGTGLGLSTVYGIVKQSAGDIWITSAPGAGTAFTILLPIAPTGKPEVREPRVPPAKSPSAIPDRILLVEDDDGVREFACGVLVQAGYEVLAARNGVEGLAVAKQHGYALDGVVTDVVMPEMGGRAMVEQLRINLPGVRVLYISGYTDDVHMLGELRASDATLLEKPFTAEALTSAVGGARPVLPVS
jgi:CheY-like chemotaxis protein